MHSPAFGARIYLLSEMQYTPGGVMKFAAIVLLAASLPMAAQEIKLPLNLDRLAAKAEETVEVTLDGPLLRLAGRFLSGDDRDANAGKLVAGLESIMVRSFEFAREGQYDLTDVDAMRAQVKGPQWSRIVGVTSKRDGEHVDVYFKDGGNGNLGGIVVISAEPKELTIVSITGTLDPAQLAGLGGHFGIPELNLSFGRLGGLR
jgi:hypothetical protein